MVWLKAKYYRHKLHTINLRYMQVFRYVIFNLLYCMHTMVNIVEVMSQTHNNT